MNKKIIFGTLNLMFFVVMALPVLALGGNDGFNSESFSSGWDCANDIEESGGTYELSTYDCAFADKLNIKGDNVVIKGEGASLPVYIYGEGVSIISGTYDNFVIESGGEAEIINSNFFRALSSVRKGGKLSKLNNVELDELYIEGTVSEFSDSNVDKLNLDKGANFLMKSGKILMDIIVSGGSYAEFRGGVISDVNIKWGGIVGFPSGSVVSNSLGVITIQENGKFVMNDGEVGGIKVDGGEMELIGGTVKARGIDFLKGSGNIKGSTKCQLVSGCDIDIHSSGLEISGGTIGKIIIFSTGSVNIYKNLGNAKVFSLTGNPDMINGQYKLNPEKFGEYSLNGNLLHTWETNIVEDVKLINTVAKTTFLNNLKSELENKIENDVLGGVGCGNKFIKDFYVGEGNYNCNLDKCPTSFQYTACCGDGRNIDLDFKNFNIPEANSEIDFIGRIITPLTAEVTCKKGESLLKFEFKVPFDTSDKKIALWNAITT